jgi:hypothetical protein
MKSVKSLWKTLLLAVISFVLGGILFRFPPVKAQGKTVVSVDKGYLGTGHVLIDAGSQVVGFSCVQSQSGDSECYVASVGR